jgi:hypothetical protein
MRIIRLVCFILISDFASGIATNAQISDVSFFHQTSMITNFNWDGESKSSVAATENISYQHLTTYDQNVRVRASIGLAADHHVNGGVIDLSADLRTATTESSGEIFQGQWIQGLATETSSEEIRFNVTEPVYYECNTTIDAVGSTSDGVTIGSVARGYVQLRRADGSTVFLMGAGYLEHFHEPHLPPGRTSGTLPPGSYVLMAEARCFGGSITSDSVAGNGSATTAFTFHADTSPPRPIQITKADIRTDTIEVVLNPATDSGELALILAGDFGEGASETTLFQGVKSGGTYIFSFGAQGLPPLRQYGQVRATWTLNGNANGDSKDVAFFTLGTYRHSQYNTPSEADPTCQSDLRPVYITDGQCNFSPATLLAKFVSQVNINGSGRSIHFGSLKREETCLKQKTAPNGSQEKSFRQIDVITPACTSMVVDGTTVARKREHPYLNCGDQVLIVGLGGGAGAIKTVTDLCPKCPETQLDNYTTDGRCALIPDLGRFVTIRLR